jgi:hypothetical protein
VSTVILEDRDLTNDNFLLSYLRNRLLFLITHLLLDHSFNFIILFIEWFTALLLLI